LWPLAAAPAGAPDKREVAGTQVVDVVEVRHVSRRKIWLPVLFWPDTRLFEPEANATNSPVPLTDGPDEVRGGRIGISPCEALLQFASPPPMPLFAGDPLKPTSTSTGSPATVEGVTAKTSGVEIPPPGAGFETCPW